MNVYRSRLLLAAMLAVGLSAGSAWAGGRGSGGKGSPCAANACKGKCTDCGQPCQAGSDTAKGGTANGCNAEFCCEEDCCCDDPCCAEGCGEECRQGECCDPYACSEDDGCCCDGWFFGNWFKGWGASSSKFNYANKNCSPGMKCEQLKAATTCPYPLGYSYGAAAYGKPWPAAPQPPICGPHCWGPCGVMQAAADACACKCGCSKCECGKGKQAACQAGGPCGFNVEITCGGEAPCPGPCVGPCCPAGFGPPPPAPPHHGKFAVALPPPPAPPGCPGMGPHAGVFHKLADVMAENAALHARLQAKADWADEQECLRAALGEARQEIARLTAAQQHGGNRDQVLVEWMKSQAEASARKDEMLVEVVAAVVEMHATKAEATDTAKLEAKVAKLQAALEQAKAENARLRSEVVQHRRGAKRVSTSGDSTGYPSSPYGTPAEYKVQTGASDCPK